MALVGGEAAVSYTLSFCRRSAVHGCKSSAEKKGNCVISRLTYTVMFFLFSPFF